MTAGVLVFMIDWRIALICWSIFILIVLTTRYVSLGAVIGCSVMPFIQYFLLGIGGLPEFFTVLLCVILVDVRHEQNIRRLFKGQESRLSFDHKKTQ